MHFCDGNAAQLKNKKKSINMYYYYYYYYYYLFTAIVFAPGGSGPYTTQLQQKIYINNNKKTCHDYYKVGELACRAVALGGVSVLATGPKVRGFKPGRRRWILRVIKSVARLPSERK
jgi:hypothetical protein